MSADSVECYDLQCLADFALYINNTGSAVDGKHAAINSWFWWAWNANSGDTGGIVSGASSLQTLHIFPNLSRPAKLPLQLIATII